MPKKCTTCGSGGPFYKRSDRPCGETAQCQKCILTRNEKYRVENLASRRPHNARLRRLWRWKKLGLTEALWEALFEAQGGKCKICGASEVSWHTDHDHASGKVRGILCGPCNQGLGLFKDDTSLLRKAADYLDDSRRTAGT